MEYYIIISNLSTKRMETRKVGKRYDAGAVIVLDNEKWRVINVYPF